MTKRPSSSDIILIFAIGAVLAFAALCCNIIDQANERANHPITKGMEGQGR